MQETGSARAREEMRFRIADPNRASTPSRCLRLGPTRSSGQLRRRCRRIIRSRWRWRPNGPMSPPSSRVQARRHDGGRAGNGGEARFRYLSQGRPSVRSGPAAARPIANFVLWITATGAIFGSRRTTSATSIRTQIRAPVLGSSPLLRRGRARRSATRPTCAAASSSTAAPRWHEHRGRDRRGHRPCRAEGGRGHDPSGGCADGRVAPALLGDSDSRSSTAPPAGGAGTKDQMPVVLPEDIDFETPGNPARPPPDWSMWPPRNAAAWPCRETDTSTPSSIPSWYSSASPASRRTAVRQGAAERWLPVIIISAGSSMRFCICSMRALKRGAAAARHARPGRTVPGPVHSGMVTHLTIGRGLQLAFAEEADAAITAGLPCQPRAESKRCRSRRRT